MSRYLSLSTFLVGAAVMVAELATSRLVAPFLGTSTPVWAAIIGTVLASMAAGQLLGGRLAARSRGPALLGVVLLVAAAFVAALPFVVPPVLRGSLELFRAGAYGRLLTGAAVVQVLLAFPLLALGAAGPIILDRAVAPGAPAGAVAGRVYALGTLGSLLGTWLAGIVLVPWLGPRLTLGGCAGLLAVAGARGLASRPARVAATAATAAALFLVPRGPLHPRPGLLYEAQTPYDVLQVVETARDRRLLLGEGYAVQSVFPLDGSLPLDGVWGFYGASAAWTATGEPRDILLLGLGGGTSARVLHALHPDARIVGVELDPAVVEAGRRWFGLPPEVEVHVADARPWLEEDDGRYDVIIVDAFRFPYVPFQLATREFMVALRDHLAPGGVVMLNIGRDGEAREVVDAVAATLASVFPRVRQADAGAGSNTMLVATAHPRDAGPSPFWRGRLPVLRPWRGQGPVLTDERAPVELLTDAIVLRRLLGRAS